MSTPRPRRTLNTTPRGTFGGQKRVAIGQQPTVAYDLNPGAGLVEVASGDGRVSQFTHYQFGTTIRSRGHLSNIMELWLGDNGTGQPNFSVRGWTNGYGALVQARNAKDTSGVQIDFLHPLRPRLAVEDNGFAGDSRLAIENPEPGGSVSLATKVGGEIVDHCVVMPDGTVRIKGSAALGADASTPIRLHGTAGSGLPQPNPGLLRETVNTHQLAAELAATNTTVNALLIALREHGLIAPS